MSVRQLLRHPWTMFLGRRTLRLLLSLGFVLTASFAMIRLVPGDPVRAALGVDAAPDLVAARRHALGLDTPFLAQYWHYLSGLLHGDLGTSLVTGTPVAEMIRTRLPATLEIAGLAFVVTLVVALPGGLLAAVRTRDGRRPRTELAFTAVTAGLAGVPDFVLAAGLTALLAVGLQLLPVAGAAGVGSFVLPVLALSLAPTAVLLRMVRVEALKVLNEDYLRTARSKRLSPARRYFWHAAPNTATAALTVAGSLLPALIAGTVLVEKVFAWPGIGSAMAQSAVAQDYPVVQAMVLVLGATVLLAGLLVDVLLAVLDPRSAIREM
ncbi:ABC transporter permease [Streptomyces sp. NPDC050529]|uniref:ABC transporter permease n=1 Tax=unclassified Streptomyces TaxID=2593676 RepID=UPI002DD93D36|nr:ABC transporter permease [Streptomyces sp. NBC_01022]WRZ79221.1 ABC transporter permease [Streptomyces sp. NBC_01022]WRZ86455.1 ABC transporter permease [Streptomyces sp. NBC_01022]